MNRECSQCGKDFPAKRPTARYCSSSCRAKASIERKRQKQVADVVASLPPIGTEDQGERAGRLVATVRRQLEDANTLDTYAGQQALILARRMDEFSPMENGSQLASLSKELDRLMTALLANVAPQADALDELQGNVVPMRRRRA